MEGLIYGKKVDNEYEKILRDYLRTKQKKYLYQIEKFSKELMKQEISPEVIVEMHLQAIKKINKNKKTFSKEIIDESFTFLMEGIIAFKMSYQENLNFQKENYLAEIRELNRKLSEKLAEMTTLYKIAKLTSSSLDLDDMLSSAFNSAVKILNAETGSLMIFDPEEEVLTIKRAHGLNEEIIRNTRIKKGESIVGLVAQNGEPLIIHGRADISQIKGRKKYEKVNSICVPLKTKKGVIGVINLNRKGDAKPFTQDNLKLLFTMANDAAYAIENATLYQNLHESYLSIIRAMVSALELKDSYIRGHSEAVTRYAVALAQRLKLSPQEIKNIEIAAILHDIGKIGIHEDILSKPGRLNDKEWEEVKKHPEFSYKILKEVNFPWDIKPVIYAHHERYNGKGYPAGLKGKEIPLGARILAVADTFAAMTSDRPYRSRFSKEVVIGELKKIAGTQLDPDLVETFLKIVEKKS
ncbi:phosphohydrolase [Candidatus Atribacteria bacterium HGW-Atribacteria-1]|nr:MAG: phosphohydrolase [Candidatus Atribacteria bacterium HGW-Atribacteria-1]